MKATTLLQILAIVALAVVVVGFYRGWFAFSANSDRSGGNKVDVNISVDPDKAKADLNRLGDRAAGHAGDSR